MDRQRLINLLAAVCAITVFGFNTRLPIVVASLLDVR